MKALLLTRSVPATAPATAPSWCAEADTPATTHAARLFVGVLLAGPADEPGAMRLRLPDGRGVACRPALGCLVRPGVDDRVLAVMAGPRGSEGAWILQVLERAAAHDDALTVDLRAHAVTLQARCLTLDADQLSLRADTLRQSAHDHSSHVSGSELHRAGSFAVHAQQHAGVHARLTTVTADALLKMDAAQIHMG